MKEKAFAALVQLQWFITEQVEEEKTAREIVAKFHLLQGRPGGAVGPRPRAGRALGRRRAVTASRRLPTLTGERSAAGRSSN